MISQENDALPRILDFIKGKPLSSHIPGLSAPHEKYFHEMFPGILDHFMEAVQAIAYIHERGEKHGDIRRDHILIDAESGIYRWIDFDFNYRHRENIYGYDLFGPGNILLFLTGKGDVLLADLKNQEHPAMKTPLNFWKT